MNTAILNNDSPKNNWAWVGVSFGVSALLLSLVYGWQGNVGLNLADEGFLWYGVQRVLHGEIPIRDFMSYEPGRYYWAALFCRAQADSGIMALRLSVAFFQWIGLFLALTIITGGSKVRSFPYLFLVALILLTWMLPRHKLFDITLSISLVAALAFLCSRPTLARAFLCGLCIGLTACFGRNHGVYGLAGGLTLFLWLRVSQKQAGLASLFMAWGAGIAVGFSPILAMVICIPGFAEAFWEHQIRFLFLWKATNLALPVPWPWLANFSVPFGNIVREIAMGMFFIALPLWGICGLFWLFRKKTQDTIPSPVLVASICMTLPYAHYAFSRADLGHLALGIFPFLIGATTLFAIATGARTRLLCVLGLCLLSLWLTGPAHPGIQYLQGWQRIALDVGRDKLLVDQRTHDTLQLLQELNAKYSPGDRPFLIAPFWPGAYAFFEKRAPMWDIYPIVARPKAYQTAELERIREAGIGFALISDWMLDGRDELRFRHVFHDIFQYIDSSYNKVASFPEGDFTLYLPEEQR